MALHHQNSNYDLTLDSISQKIPDSHLKGPMGTTPGGENGIRGRLTIVEREIQSRSPAFLLRPFGRPLLIKIRHFAMTPPPLQRRSDVLLCPAAVAAARPPPVPVCPTDETDGKDPRLTSCRSVSSVVAAADRRRRILSVERVKIFRTN